MKNNKNKALIVIIVISALAAVAVAAFLAFKAINNKQTEDGYKNLASSVMTSTESTEEATSPTDITSPKIDSASVKSPVDFDALTKQNSDIYAWINIPDTNINYPVCQSNVDDNFYLDHDVYKNYSFAGTIYSQVCNNREFTDRVTLLYGHNMANGSMFANLHYYSDRNFFDSHNKIYVYTPEHKLTYEVISAFIYDDRHIMNSFDFSDDTQFQSYLDTLKNPRSISATVNDSVELSTQDKIITLSTCLNSGEGRYLVSGKLIKDEKVER